MRLRNRTALKKICSEIAIAIEILGNATLENFLKMKKQNAPCQ